MSLSVLALLMLLGLAAGLLLAGLAMLSMAVLALRMLLSRRGVMAVGLVCAALVLVAWAGGEGGAPRELAERPAGEAVVEQRGNAEASEEPGPAEPGGDPAVALNGATPMAVRSPTDRLKEDGTVSTWSPAVEREAGFEAEVHPSLEAAGQALGRRVGRAFFVAEDPEELRFPERAGPVPRPGEGETLPVRIRVLRAGEPLIETGVEAIGTGLREAIEVPLEVYVEMPGDGEAVEREAVDVSVLFERSTGRAAWDRQREVAEGWMSAKRRGQEQGYMVRFVDKPWVEDPAGFANEQGQRGYVVGFSREFQASQEAAEAEAVDAAVEQVVERVHAQSREDVEVLRPRVRAALKAEGMVVDRFAQSFERPFGTVWRAAVLVDASPAVVERIAEGARAERAERERGRRNVLVSAGGLGAVVLGAYLFLNAATRGYYTWALRGVGLLALVVGAAAIGLWLV